MRNTIAIIYYICISTAAALAQSSTNFSGEWKLNPGRSDLGKMASPPENALKIEQSASSINVLATFGDGSASKSLLYPLDGRTEKRHSGELSFNTQTKWEGAAMLANTIVTGAGKNYTIMERWRLSANGGLLTIRRTIVNSSGEAEATLVYDSPGAAAAPALAPRPTLTQNLATESEVAIQAHPALAAARPTGVADDFFITSGTRILLRLRNPVDTKHSAPGDRVYLETAYPVFVNQLLVIPQGSYVMGSVVESERAGKVKGRSALNIRFDSITLPNGVTRDFRSRVGSAEGAEVDREEGRIKGESGKGNDARTVATTTAAGAGIGTIAGAAKGASLKGLGIGSAAGAAAGLASILLTRGPDVVLRPGTSVEMVLDRDLRFTADELTHRER